MEEAEQILGDSRREGVNDVIADIPRVVLYARYSSDTTRARPPLQISSVSVKGSRTLAAATRLRQGRAAGVAEASGEETGGKWGRTPFS